MGLIIDFAAMQPGATITVRLADGTELIITADGVQNGHTNGRVTGQVVSLPLPLLDELLPAFLRYQEVHRGLLPNTVGDLSRRCKRFLAWLAGRNIDQVEPSHWIAYYVHVKRNLKSEYSIRNEFRAINKFAVWLADDGLLPVNPLQGIIPPSGKKESVDRKAIQIDDLTVMLNRVQTVRERAILMFFRDTGCRAGEAVAMRWGNVHLRRRVAHTTGKGNKPRDLLFKPATARALEAYKKTVPHKKTDAVWWGDQGPLTYSGIYQLFKRIARRAGVDGNKFSPHSWRHAFGRDANRNGMPTATLQRILGHESIETTMIYTDPTEDDLRAAHDRYGPALPPNPLIDLDDDSD